MAVTKGLIVLDTNVALFYLSGRLVNPLPIFLTAELGDN